MSVEIYNRRGEVIHTVDGVDTLVGAKLNDLNLSCAYFNRTNLSGVDFTGSTLFCADFSGADLRGANFSRADIARCEFAFANLSDAFIRDANLARADFTGANMSGACLCGTLFRGAILTRANLKGAEIADGWVCMGQWHHITNVGLGPTTMEVHRRDTLELYQCDSGWYVRLYTAGGSVEEFLAIVENEYHNEYDWYERILAAHCV